MVVVVMTLGKKHRVLTTGVLMAADVLSDVLQTSMQQSVYKYEILHNMGAAFHCVCLNSFGLFCSQLISCIRQTFVKLFFFVRKVVLTNFVVCSRNC